MTGKETEQDRASFSSDGEYPPRCFLDTREGNIPIDPKKGLRERWYVRLM